MNENIEHALAAYEDATNRYRGIAPSLESQAELSAVQLMARVALDFEPTATHMLMESSDQGEFMCAPHALQRDGVDLFDVQWDVGDARARADQWQDLIEQYDLHGAGSWLTWGHTAWERFVDTDHPYTSKRSGYLALDLRKIGATL